MMVELLVRWTDLKFAPVDETEALLRKVVDGDDNPNKPKIEYTYSPMTFDMEDVRKFNPGNDKDHTTLRFVNHETNVVKMAYRDFQQFFVECTGKVVHSALPEDWQGEGAGDDGDDQIQDDDDMI